MTILKALDIGKAANEFSKGVAGDEVSAGRTVVATGTGAAMGAATGGAVALAATAAGIAAAPVAVPLAVAGAVVAGFFSLFD